MALFGWRADLVDFHYLQKVLPTFTIESITDIGGGFSGAQILHLNCKEGPLLARKSAGFYGREGFEHEMKICSYVASFSLAPKIRFYDSNLLVSVSDYLDDLGFINLYRFNQELAQQKVIALAQSLHRINCRPFMKIRNIVEEAKASMLEIPKEYLEKSVLHILHRALATPWPMDNLVLTHNDFHPGNILFDGHKLQLIDWEMAGLGHPFYDIAYLSNYLFLDKDNGYNLLSGYLGIDASQSDKSIFDSFRRLGYAFLAIVNFQTTYHQHYRPVENNTDSIQRNFENIYHIWAKASKENNLHSNYQLGMIFANECSKH